MSRQLRINFPGAIHHITSRGNVRRIIYRDDRDRRRFLEILEEVVVLRHWILQAWALMSNHYHLLIGTPEVGLSHGMKKLNESYASLVQNAASSGGPSLPGAVQEYSG